MIEVEKKFQLDAEREKRLLEGATFLGEKTFTDIYYDTDDLRLELKDQWLRSREGKFEMKIGIRNTIQRQADQYNEVVDETSTRERLGLGEGGNFMERLEEKGYRAFCVCKTTRKKYKRGPFTIDLDVVEFGNLDYRLAEIELMVESEAEMGAAVDRIVAFAQENGLRTDPVQGKVTYYLRHARPEHYETLVNAGVVRDFRK